MKRTLALLLMLLSVSSCERPVSEHTVITLPQALREASGLTMATEDSVFTHNDEHAIVHEINISQGHTVRIFALGDPTIEGDFEGIAYATGLVYLITSDGIIYAATPGADRERVAYRAYDTGIGPICEIEGLSGAPTSDHLLVLCKRLRRAEDQPRLEVYRWALGADQAEMDPWLSIPLPSILDEDEIAEFRPSAIEWDPHRERLIVVSGKSQLFLQFDRQGQLISRQRLDAQRHRQTEGLTILPDCQLLLADEGSDTREARISVYPCPP